jgi:hypothetical protein
VKEVLEDLKGRKPAWLKKSAEKMVEVTVKEWEMWRNSLSIPQEPATTSPIIQ